MRHSVAAEVGMQLKQQCTTNRARPIPESFARGTEARSLLGAHRRGVETLWRILFQITPGRKQP